MILADKRKGSFDSFPILLLFTKHHNFLLYQIIYCFSFAANFFAKNTTKNKQ